MSAACMLLFVGCRLVSQTGASATETITTGHAGGAYRPKNSDKYDLENTSQFVLLDYDTQHSITCDGIREQRLADNRLKVTANIRNREDRNIQIQVSCVFKDAQGFTVDEMPFQDLFLDKNAQEGVAFTSMNSYAQRYTIRVRQAR